MKLVWGCPTYGPLDPQAVISQRVALMHAAGNGVEWVGDASPDRMPYAAARNALAQAAIKTEADGVFWCDSDVVLPVDAVTRLVAAEKDFITGIYYQRREPHFPLIAFYNEQRDTYNWAVDWPESVIAPIDGCGFGCVLTSTKLLRAIGEKHEFWFKYEKFSEDFHFCRLAKDVGVQLYVDTGVQCGHLADPVPITREHFVAWRTRETGLVMKEAGHGV